MLLNLTAPENKKREKITFKSKGRLLTTAPTEPRSSYQVTRSLLFLCHRKHHLPSLQIKSNAKSSF